VERQALAHLKVAQQVGKKTAFHAIDAHIEPVALGSRCDGVGTRLLLAGGIRGQERNKLPRFEIEPFQFRYGEFKMETCGGL
jgi:hypothetical protein